MKPFNLIFAILVIAIFSTSTQVIFAQISDLKAASILMPEVDQYRMAFQKINFDEPCGFASVPDGVPPVLPYGKKSDPCTKINDWGVWVDGIYKWNELESTYFIKNHTLESVGATLGFEQIIGPRTVLGLMGGYERHKLENGGLLNKEKIDLDDAFIGLYGGHRCDNDIELKVMLGCGFQNYKSKRSISPYQFDGEFKGWSFMFNFEASRPFTFEYFVLRPVIGFDLNNIHQKSFNEEINSLYNVSLMYDETSLTHARGRIGLRADTGGDCWRFQTALFYSRLLHGETRPDIEYMYQNDQTDSWLSATSSLGRSVITYEAGIRWSSGIHTLHIDYIGDFYTDRDGSPTQNTIRFGYIQRF